MRREIRKISTLDLNPSIGIGIALPFNNHNVFTTNYTTKDQVRSNLINFLLTNKNERVMNPNFGADLRSLVFSQIDDLDSLKNIISDRISLYVDKILINEINILPDIDKNLVKISILYGIKNNPQNTDSIQINLQ